MEQQNILCKRGTRTFCPWICVDFSDMCLIGANSPYLGLTDIQDVCMCTCVRYYMLSCLLHCIVVERLSKQHLSSHHWWSNNHVITTCSEGSEVWSDKGLVLNPIYLNISVHRCFFCSCWMVLVSTHSSCKLYN
jgi:hypothetical protein